MLTMVKVARYGTAATKSKAKKEGNDPDATFEAEMPDLGGTDFEMVEDFVKVLRYENSEQLWRFVYKHVLDRKRAAEKPSQAKALQARLSEQQEWNGMLVDFFIGATEEERVKYKEYYQENPTSGQSYVKVWKQLHPTQLEGDTPEEDK